MKYDMSDPAIRELLDGLEDERAATATCPRRDPPAGRFEPTQADLAAYGDERTRIVQALRPSPPEATAEPCPQQVGQGDRLMVRRDPDVPKQ